MKKIIVTGEQLWLEPRVFRWPCEHYHWATEPPGQLTQQPEPYPGYTIMYSKFLFLYTFHKTLFQDYVNGEK